MYKVIKNQYQLLIRMLHHQENAGKRIQNYVFNYSDCIGKGNFSKVYKAYHQVTNEIFAIKIIELSSLKSQKLEELLFSQIDVLKKLDHPNVLKCIQVFTSNHRCYIITEFCNQGDLESKLRKVRTFTQSQAEPIIRDIFSGLLYLSEMHIVHRDIKVANVFMHNGRAKIADFGFAKFTTQKWHDVNIGSPIYMSPQGFIDNIYGPKTDVWAFGVLLYELFHGESPYAKCHSQLQLKTLIRIPLGWNQFRTDLSQQIRQIILRCLEVNEQKRITFEQLKYFPYIRNLLEGGYRIMPLLQSNPIERERKSDLYKPSSHKQLQNNSYRRNLVQIRSDRITSPTNARQIPYQSMSVQKLPKNNFVPHNFSNLNNLELQHVSLHVPGPHFEREDPYTPGSPNISNRSSFVPLLISCAITFKESVNLLHYCRLLYKFVCLNREIRIGCEQTTAVLHGFLMAILGEISQRIEMKGIIYDGQNVWLREKKLREVTDQYTKKYTKQLGYISLNPGIGLGTIKDMTYDQFLEIDAKLGWQSPEQHILLGHNILVIWHSSRFIQQCYEQRSYKSFGNYKQIQNLLNKMKGKLDYSSYQSYKQKLCD